MPRLFARSMILVLPLWLAACQQEPDFDARYDKAQGAISEKVSELDAEMRTQEDRANESVKPEAEAVQN